jgi:hypothetical protein
LLIARSRLAAASFTNLFTRRSASVTSSSSSSQPSLPTSPSSSNISKQYWAITTGVPRGRDATTPLANNVMGVVNEPLRHVRFDYLEQRINKQKTKTTTTDNKNDSNNGVAIEDTSGSDEDFIREQVLLASDPRAAKHKGRFHCVPPTNMFLINDLCWYV